MQTITLEFKKTMAALVGNPYGKSVFEEQVAPKIDNNENDKITIVFPDNITYATSSFIQGFFDFWLRTMGIDKVREKIVIKSNNDRLVKGIWEEVK